MAHDEHVSLLKQAVDGWNAWRNEKPDFRRTSAMRTSAGRTSAGRSSCCHSGAVLERLRDKFRDLDYVPCVQLRQARDRDFTETVRLLCKLSHFVIVDITKPQSAPLEPQADVPNYMIPFVPILKLGQKPFAMFVDLQNKYDWVLDKILYPSVERLIQVTDKKILKSAEAKFNEQPGSER